MILLAAGVFTAIGFKIDWQQTANSVKNANLYWLLGATVTMLYAHYLRGWRWNMLTEPAGYPLNKIRAFYAVMIGYLVNVATSRGGEFVRCAMAAKSEKAPVPTLVGSVVTERIIDLLVLMSLCLLCLGIQFQEFYGFFDQYIITPLGKH
ncbi:MAG: lysylphosphatidylglycerol synthase transmembrane domain-containing protein, partial [Bacteroidota bacterium]